MTTEELAVKIVKYFLNVLEKKVPIKRIDIINGVGGGINTKIFLEALPKVKTILSETFGYRLLELNIKNSKLFYIAPRDITSHLIVPPEKQAEIALLHLVLMYIFMKGGKVTDTMLWKFLEGLEVIDELEEEHSYFGEVNKLITETFVKHNYLVREKVDEEGGVEFTIYYSWGVRADLELAKKDVLEYVAVRYNFFQGTTR
ncbi:hypothetical protein DMENIID0001_169760 [Sergentomyia squamirostris]